MAAISSIRKYCKDNKIICADYTHKFIAPNYKEYNQFIDKTANEKYFKIMFYLELSKIDKKLAIHLNKKVSLNYRDYTENRILL